MKLLPVAALAFLMISIPAFPDAQPTDDPYQWLEEIDGNEALDWVRTQNALTQKALGASADFDALQSRLRAIYDSDDRIPEVEQLGRWVYNFWRDTQHPRGIWRRTTREEYRKAEPAWDTVLDLDALARQENENWVWKGAECLYPDYRRCLLRLSRGGADAHVVREFDLDTRRFVTDGFVLPEAKHRVAWRDADSLLLVTDTGAGSLTVSGYPRIVREWRRGTAPGEARALFEAQAADVAADVLVYHAPGSRHEIIARAISFFRYEYFLRAGDHLAKLAVPEDAELDLFGNQLLLQLRSDWAPVPQHRYPAGSLLALPLVRFIEGERDFQVLFAPTAEIVLDGYSRTRNGLLLNLLDRVRSRVAVLRHRDGLWQRGDDLPVPDLSRVRAFGIDPDHSDDYFLTVEDFLQPTRLLEGRIGSSGQTELKRLPAYFDADGLRVEQRQATSRDGTRIPYFEVSRADHDTGTRPTLLYGYGGFEISLTPGYSAGVGAAWLERGGVYVVANIRGGGEFGPAWHQAALREHRQRAYDDFIAVAEDLIRRGITTTRQLGIMGGSNGGLLVGAVMTQRPDLFGAVVCRVPLLDMRRYHRLLAGASWMSEYGNPDDPADWAFISRYSPYQNLHEDRDYPPILLTTSTRDDRVHPGHARKFAARLEAQKHLVHYYENLEGGHGGAANHLQRAHMDALGYAFLWEQLQRRPEKR